MSKQPSLLTLLERSITTIVRNMEVDAERSGRTFSRYDGTDFRARVSPYLQAQLQASSLASFGSIVIESKFPSDYWHRYCPTVTLSLLATFPRYITGDRYYQDVGRYYMDVLINSNVATLTIGEGSELTPEGMISLGYSTYEWRKEGKIFTIAPEHEGRPDPVDFPHMWKLGWYGFNAVVLFRIEEEKKWMRESLLKTQPLPMNKGAIPFQIEGYDQGVLIPV